MAIDLKNLKAKSTEDLKAESAKLSAALAGGREMLKAVNDELTLRENMAIRMPHIEKLSDAELDRLLEERRKRRQGISGAGAVASEEAVDASDIRRR